MIYWLTAAGSRSPDHDDDYPDVDLFQLGMNTLRRYRKQWSIHTRPGLTKPQVTPPISFILVSWLAFKWSSNFTMPFLLPVCFVHFSWPIIWRATSKRCKWRRKKFSLTLFTWLKTIRANSTKSTSLRHRPPTHRPPAEMAAGHDGILVDLGLFFLNMFEIVCVCIFFFTWFTRWCSSLIRHFCPTEFPLFDACLSLDLFMCRGKWRTIFTNFISFFSKFW